MGDESRRDTPTPDGWGARNVPEPVVRSSKPRKRITLRFEAPALTLPDESVGERAGGALDDDFGGSVELELPSDVDSDAVGAAADAIAAEAPSESSDEEDLAGRDGWARSRPSATSPPPAPARRSEVPPAMRDAESTDSLRLVSARSRPTPATPPDLAAEMNDRFALGDFSGALRSAELLLGQVPEDLEAKQVAATSRERLVHFHLARLGGLGAVLDLKVAGAEVRWLGLDHRAGYLLSCVDGTTTVEEIVDLSGMPKHEALRLLAELLDGGAVTRIA